MVDEILVIFYTLLSIMIIQDLKYSNINSYLIIIVNLILNILIECSNPELNNQIRI